MSNFISIVGCILKADEFEFILTVLTHQFLTIFVRVQNLDQVEDACIAVADPVAPIPIQSCTALDWGDNCLAQWLAKAKRDCGTDLDLASKHARF